MAISATKATLNVLLQGCADIVLEPGLERERDTMRSSDHREAVGCLRPGRSPEFTGT